ncbi:hypothetical protein V2J09_023470 [Rumex salicifolius]
MASNYLRAFICKYGAALPLMMGLDSDYRHIKDQSDYTRNVRQEFPDSTIPAVIAVMGLPFTGMDSISEMLGVWLGSPVYDIQAPLHVLTLSSQQQQHDNIDDDDEVGARVSFDIICRMAGSHLTGRKYGLNCAIITSTFFNYKWQLDRLLDITYELQIRAHNTTVCTPQILVIECRRKNGFQWQLNAGETWKDVKKAYQELTRQQAGDEDEYFIALSRAYSLDIKKLVVDPFEDISHAVSDFGGRGYSALFASGIKYMLTCDDIKLEQHEIPIVVDYAQWRRQQLDQRRYGWIVAASDKRCRPGDCLFRFGDNLGISNCEICEEGVTMEGLTLHQDCATKTTNLVDSEAKAYSCCSCVVFSVECESCLLRTFIKSLPLPLIFNHDGGDDHPLCLRLVDELSPFVCKACGLGGWLASYGCHICKAQYHLGCLRAPMRTEIRHGGHLHWMDRRFNCAVEDDEYEWCLACYTDIDPKTWVYTCQDCDYVAHLYCVFPSIIKESQHQFF